jgi:archaellum component FlaF (FlaF/FlaG flagellin family)
MSSSNAAAIRRRVTQQQAPTPTIEKPTPPQSNNKQMTIQQVITTMDQRLKQIETIVQNNSSNNTEDLPVIVDEFNSRFEMIVTEMNSLKDIVMQLQTYTMNVNKTLYDERINILSDLGNETITSADNTELLSVSNSQDNLVKLELTDSQNISS